MSLFVTFESMDNDIIYTCKSYQYLHGTCGYYFYIIIRKYGDNGDKVMIVRDGILYDWLIKMIDSNSFTRFTFKKMNTQMSTDNSQDNVIIPVHNPRIALN